MHKHSLLKRAVAVGVLALGLGMGAVAGAETLHWAYQGDVNSLDPMAMNEAFNIEFQKQFYESLAAYDEDLNLVPLLAESWENPEPTKWIFHLREGVKFHDGSAFTADDVVFSWQRSLTHGSDMKGYGAMASDVKKIDDLTVEVTTTEPNPILPREWVFLAMMSKSWSEANNTAEATNHGHDDGNYANMHENGTGPFVVTSRQPDVRTTLKRFDDYWGDISTNVTEIVFQPIKQNSTRVAALLSGDMDFIRPVPVQDWNRLKDTDGIELMLKPEARAIFIGMDQWRDELLFSNVKGKNPFKDKRVREAINRAVETDVINQKIMRGAAQPLGTVIAEGVNGFDMSYGKPYEPDLEKAKQLLEEAGYPDGFQVTLDCPNDRYVNDEQICQAVASMLARINIKVDVLAQTKSKYFAQVLPHAGNSTSMYLLGWSPASLDAQNVLLNLVACQDDKAGTGQFNLGRYCNPDVDALIARIGVETDQDKRNEMIKEAFTIARDDFSYLALHQQPISWAVRSGMQIEQHANDMTDIRTVMLP